MLFFLEFTNTQLLIKSEWKIIQLILLDFDEWFILYTNRFL